MQGKKGTARIRYTKIARACASGDELDVAYAVLRKVARNLDDCDSSRDIKPLVSCLFETTDRIKALEAKQGQRAKVTPLAEVVKMAAGG